MVTQLFRLVYCSRSLVPSNPASWEREIGSILQASRRNNNREHVTGALIFNSGVFAQVLEGLTAPLEATFERIQRDDRHSRVQVLALDKIESRAFPDWSMGFVGRSHEGEKLFAHVAEATGFDDKRLEGEKILQTMLAIAHQEDGTA